MASNTSKTARASVRAGQAGQGGALSVLGEFKYLIPLNGGKHAYVRNLTNGKTVHLRTDSDAFVEEIRVLAAAGHATKIRAEITGLAAQPGRRLGHHREAPGRGRRLRGLSPSPQHSNDRPPGAPVGGRCCCRGRSAGSAGSGQQGHHTGGQVVERADHREVAPRPPARPAGRRSRRVATVRGDVPPGRQRAPPAGRRRPPRSPPGRSGRPGTPAPRRAARPLRSASTVEPTAPQRSWPSTTTSGTPSATTANSIEPSTAWSSTCAPERITQIDPKVWSKIASSGTRESMQPTTTACGCWSPEATAAAALTSCPCSGCPLTNRRLPASSSASARPRAAPDCPRRAAWLRRRRAAAEKSSETACGTRSGGKEGQCEPFHGDGSPAARLG